MRFSVIDSINQNIFGGVWTLGSHLGMLFALDPSMESHQTNDSKNLSQNNFTLKWFLTLIFTFWGHCIQIYFALACLWGIRVKIHCVLTQEQEILTCPVLTRQMLVFSLRVSLWATTGSCCWTSRKKWYPLPQFSRTSQVASVWWVSFSFLD